MQDYIPTSSPSIPDLPATPSEDLPGVPPPKPARGFFAKILIRVEGWFGIYVETEYGRRE
jgi:hypothetical protein